MSLRSRMQSKTTSKPVSSYSPPQIGTKRQKTCPIGVPGLTGELAGVNSSRLIPQSLSSQPKLTLDWPSNQYEQEANRLAGQVMRMPEPGVQSWFGPEDEEEVMLQAKPLARQITPLGQRQVGPEEEEEEPFQTNHVSGNTPQAGPGREAQIRSLRGGGQPLPTSVRGFFEPCFDHDFSRVRIHTDGQAAEAARAVSARAFTLGRDVVFGAGQYAPSTAAGRRLLAHELTHAVQQSQLASPGAHHLQTKLRAPPRRLVTSSPIPISFPKDSEAKLDKRIEGRRKQDLTSQSGTFLGTVEYRNLPSAGKRRDPEADIRRRAVKQAILDVITHDPKDWLNAQIHVRVPLSDSPVNREYAMIVLRFDAQRNVEAEYAGSHTQERGHYRVALEQRLGSLAREYSVTFVTDSVKLRWGSKLVSFPGKNWEEGDAALLNQTLPLLGTREKAALKGIKFRRLDWSRYKHAAGFYTNKDHSINLMNAALLVDREIWFGEAGKFYSRGVHTLLHEIGHALEQAKVQPVKPKRKMIAAFRSKVRNESKKRRGKSPGKKFPPPGIDLPTDYSGKSWKEFFADTYAIYVTNPSFLKVKRYQYLYDFFSRHFPR